ncbi:protein FAM111A-like [Silurus asotus]|uniref:Protein FAM111A-like n=1 Tax=Silurus asotus TaxID=30991 RepID=A0AAD5B420_SILAS|nr:protein FAM111A-like [Silurus asotus]
MQNYCKEKGEKSGWDMKPSQIKTEDRGHILRFNYKSDKYEVSFNVHLTVHEILQTNSTFKRICEKWGKEKELVIRREKMSRAAITPDFPSFLLDSNELLDIMFIKSDGNSHPAKMKTRTDYSHDNLVSFYIRTKDFPSFLLDSNELLDIMFMKSDGNSHPAKMKTRTDYSHDNLGKEWINSVIFKKGILFEQESESKTDLSNLVNYLDGKCFRVRVSPLPPGSQESSQELNEELNEESSQKCETQKNIKSEVPDTAQETNPNGDSTKCKEKKPETPMKETKSTKHSDIRAIPNSEEILNLLRAQHKELIKILKERKNLKNNAEVEKFFRQEYDKSVQSFSEVKRVRKLLEMSNSVCQIRSDGSPIGSGFLLFGRFVLTNAHVVGDLVSNSAKLKKRLTAVFGFEDLNNAGNEETVEENVVAYMKSKDDIGNPLDFALLELSKDGSDLKLPELLDYYSHPSTSGDICIIGHPDGGIKRMDPCFIIPKQDIQQEAMAHLHHNSHVNMCHVWTQRCLQDNHLYHSYIPYHSCFFHGSSGSPVFDESCSLIGVHTGGYAYKEGKRTRSVMEFALPLFPALVHIFTQCSELKRDDVVQYFEEKSNMRDVLQEAKKQLQENPEPMIID